MKKLSIVLVTALLLLAYSDSYSQSVTLTVKNAPLKQVFTQIEKQTGFVIFYNKDVIKGAKPVSIAANKMPLEAFLATSFKDQPFDFLIKDKYIVLTRKAPADTLHPKPADRPGIITIPPAAISGAVFDNKTNSPMTGVSVVSKRTHKGTVTNEYGMFMLKDVSENDIISFSFIGYESVLISVSDLQDFSTVKMKIATNELDKAVVQAYGTTSKRLATGNIGKVTAEEIERQPVMNPLLALQGRVPGLMITQMSGQSSAPIKVEIRGRNSLNPEVYSDPLYIIDGVPLTVLNVKGHLPFAGISPGVIQGGMSTTGGQSPLFGLNPKDIESIEVLKDGDATAIYGSRAANGVILITTKRAKPGKTTFGLDLTQGISFVPRRLDMLNTQEYLQMRREAFRNDGVTPDAQNAPDLMVWDTTRYTDWQKELLGSGKTTAVAARLSGGDNRNTFGISANYEKRVDLLTRSGSNQVVSVAVNLNHRSLDQKLAVSLTANYNYSNVDAINDDGSIFSLPPNAPPIFDSKGNLNYAEYNASNMPYSYSFGYILKSGFSKTNTLNSNLRVSYELMNDLSLSVNTGFGTVLNANSNLNPIAAQNPLFNPTGYAIFGESKNSNWVIEPQLNYGRFISKGRLTVQIGASLQTTATRGTTTYAFGYTNDDLIGNLSGSGSQQTAEGNSLYKYGAVFGRINYNWNNKYILNLNARRDGSSRFAPGRQFGNFGSLAGAWIVSEESWMKKLLPSWFSFLKLRGSSATTGNDGVGDYQYISQWGGTDPATYQPLQDYMGIRSFIPIHAVNQNYHWESSKQLEAALNMGFLNDRITLEVAYYRKRAGDQLTQLPTPVYTGFPNVVANWIAVVQNTGLEGSIRARLIENKSWLWSANFNISANRNKLLDYPGLEFSPYANRYKIGQSLNTEYLLHFKGIDPLTGNYSYEDYNKDGRVTARRDLPAGTLGDDRYIAIDLNPKFFGGIGTDLSYRNYSLSLTFNFVKQQAVDPFVATMAGSMTNLSLPAEIRNNYWRNPGDNVRYPRFSTIGNGTLGESDGQYTDASYLRLNNAAFTYSFPEKLVKKAGMQRCDLSIRAQNLFTISNYKGRDPEVRSLFRPPSPKIIIGSLSVNF